MMQSLPRLRMVFWSTLLLLGLFSSGWFANDRYRARASQKKTHLVQMKGYRFTSPLLDVELPQGMSVANEPIPFKYKIEDFIRDQQQRGHVSKVSVYYRDLHDGPWFGIDENVVFNPASMLKVPVLMAWLRRAEKDPAVLSQRFIYDGRDDLTASQQLKPQQSIVAGRPYTVKELLHYMLNFSDNNATRLLYERMNPAELDQIMDDLNIENRPTAEGNTTTPHSYSGFFRILYNASYLNREYSEYALQLLSQQDFPQGMVAGVPAGIPVAAKFGEFSHGPPRNEYQLHEFGIVYHPRQPYVLGIMTMGQDAEKQAEIIREISRITYQAVDMPNR